jgi:hypothetical protein
VSFPAISSATSIRPRAYIVPKRDHVNIGIGYVLSHCRQAISEAPYAARYHRTCDYEISPKLRDSVRIQRYLFADRRRIARVIDGVHREQGIIRLMLDFVVGKRPYRELCRRVLSRSPRLAARFVWDCLTRKALSREPDLSTM